jgi:hypothetical protein
LQSIRVQKTYGHGSSRKYAGKYRKNANCHDEEMPLTQAQGADEGGESGPLGEVLGLLDASSGYDTADEAVYRDIRRAEMIDAPRLSSQKRNVDEGKQSKQGRPKKTGNSRRSRYSLTQSSESESEETDSDTESSPTETSSAGSEADHFAFDLGVGDTDRVRTTYDPKKAGIRKARRTMVNLLGIQTGELQQASGDEEDEDDDEEPHQKNRTSPPAAKRRKRQSRQVSPSPVRDSEDSADVAELLAAYGYTMSDTDSDRAKRRQSTSSSAQKGLVGTTGRKEKSTHATGGASRLHAQRTDRARRLQAQSAKREALRKQSRKGSSNNEVIPVRKGVVQPGPLPPPLPSASASAFLLVEQAGCLTTMHEVQIVPNSYNDDGGSDSMIED